MSGFEPNTVLRTPWCNSACRRGCSHDLPTPPPEAFGSWTTKTKWAYWGYRGPPYPMTGSAKELVASYDDRVAEARAYHPTLRRAVLVVVRHVQGQKRSERKECRPHEWVLPRPVPKADRKDPDIERFRRHLTHLRHPEVTCMKCGVTWGRLV